MAKLVYKGLKANLPVSRNADSFYLCTDTRELYFGMNLYTEAVRLFESADLDTARDLPASDALTAKGVVYFDLADNSGWVRNFDVPLGDPGDWVCVIASTESMTYQIRKLSTPTSGAFASYALFQGGEQVPTTDPTKNCVIDIPKDFLVKSADLDTVTAADKASGGKFENDDRFAVGDLYIDFTVNTRTLVKATGTYVAGTTYYADELGTILVDTSSFEEGVTDVSAYYVVDGSTESHIYLNVKELGIALKAGDGIELAGDDDDEITIKLHTGHENGLAVSADGLALGMAAAATTTYVQATGTYVAGTTYYTDSTGATEVDTTGFEEGVTDVSSYYVAQAVAAKNGAMSGEDKEHLDIAYDAILVGSF